jgi:hypothetical protein
MVVVIVVVVVVVVVAICGYNLRFFRKVSCGAIGG